MNFKYDFDNPSDVWYYGEKNMHKQAGPLWVRDKWVWKYMSIGIAGYVINPKCYANCNIEFKYHFDQSVQKGKALFALNKTYHWQSEFDAPIKIFVDLNGLVEIFENDSCIGNTYVEKDTNNEFNIKLYITPTSLKLNEIDIDLINNYPQGGYFAFSHIQEAVYYVTDFKINSNVNLPPLSKSEYNNEIYQFQKHSMEITKKNMQRLRKEISQNSDKLLNSNVNIKLAEGLINLHENIELTITYKGTVYKNAVLTIEEDYLGGSYSYPMPVNLNFNKVNDNYYIFTYKYIPRKTGNGRIVLYIDGKRYTRVFSVIDSQYTVCNFWLNCCNVELFSHQLHKYDLPGDHHIFGGWDCLFELNTNKIIDTINKYIPYCNMFGDKLSPFFGGAVLFLPGTPDYNLFDVPYDIQLEGMTYLKELWDLLKIGPIENVGCYTHNFDTIKVLLKLGIHSLDSICVWQNYDDFGWFINHLSSPINPYFASDEDFRKVGDLPFVISNMGTSTSSRAYDIFSFDGCPSNMSPSQRYTGKMSQIYGIDRHFNYIDSLINSKNDIQSPQFISIGIESFLNAMDWERANECSIDYIVAKAKNNKIVFATVADISNYYIKNFKGKQPQNAYFQPDFYSGIRFSAKPHLIEDRIEVSNSKFHTLHHKSSPLPICFWDYTSQWEEIPWKEMSNRRNYVVPPEDIIYEECVPKMVDLRDITAKVEYISNENKIKAIINIKSNKNMEYIPVALFDIPISLDYKIYDENYISSNDYLNNNSNGVYVCSHIKKGENKFYIEFIGKSKNVTSSIEKLVDDVYFREFKSDIRGNHIFIWKVSEKYYEITINNLPDNCYVKYNNGKISLPNKKGIITITLDNSWETETPILYEYNKSFKKLINCVKVSDL